MQKIVNVVAIASGVVSVAVVGSGLFVFVNRDKLVDNVKSQVMDAVVGALTPDVRLHIFVVLLAVDPLLDNVFVNVITAS